jgi:molecular chaperone HtpG
MTETRSFQAEVSRLLEIVAHSLYSDRQVFLRELVSNASDACDRRRYLALTDESIPSPPEGYRVTLRPDPATKTLVIEDNGIGMSRDELIENLGTIARSGTSKFLENLGQDSKKDVALIGQFGVGFYSAFMVADRVEVVSRRANEPNANVWISDGKGEFMVEPAEKPAPGTRIALHLREDAEEFLKPEKLRHIVHTYADHVALPIVLLEAEKEEVLNTASALWTRSKSEIDEEQYKEFYHSVAHAYDDPWATLHWKAEGTLEYTGLLYIPSTKPFDLFDPSRKHAVRLYVRRVFVTADCAELVPGWLRFLKGVVDSEDLPLNISRETLQANPLVAKIRAGLVKRVIGELGKKAEAEPESYAGFWENFGAVLKEGIYEDRDNREALLGLARFRSTHGEGLVSLDEYVSRMRPGQKAIFTITGESPEAVARSPQIEGFRAKGVEVLLLTDPVDEFWLSAVHKFKDFEFKSVTRSGADLAGIEAPEGTTPPEPEPPSEVTAPLVALLKLTLDEAVKDVRVSTRLTDSPVCLVSDEGDLDMHLARLLKQHKQLDDVAKRILEINPHHPLIKRLTETVSRAGSSAALADAAWLLLDQARILEGETLPDPVAFARRLAASLERGLVA